MSILVSELIGKIIRFGSAVKYDKDIINHSIVVNKVASDTTNNHPFLSNMDFKHYWVHEDSDTDRIEEINTL